MSGWEDLRRRFEHAIEIADEEPQRALRVLDGLLRLAQHLPAWGSNLCQ